MLFSICSYLGYKYFKPDNIQGEKVDLSLSGTIKKGKDISPQKDYCPEELYIVTKDKTYQIRTPDNSNEKPTVAYAKYRNSEVKLSATYNNIVPSCPSSDMNCGCDPFILLKSLKETKRADSFTTYSGLITCLPMLNGETITPENCAEVVKNIEDVIKMHLEARKITEIDDSQSEFVGIKNIRIPYYGAFATN